MPVKHTRHSRGTLVPAVTAPDTTVAYARLAGMSQAALTAAMEPYLPIVCVDIVLGGVGDERPAGAADPAHRSGSARGGLNLFSRSRKPE